MTTTTCTIEGPHSLLDCPKFTTQEERDEVILERGNPFDQAFATDKEIADYAAAVQRRVERERIASCNRAIEASKADQRADRRASLEKWLRDERINPTARAMFLRELADLS